MELLKSRIESDYEKIKKFIKVKLNDNQIASILSLVYNIGVGAFTNPRGKPAGSTLLRKINKNAPIEEIQKAFLMWVYHDKKQPDGTIKKEVSESLKARRQKEFELYEKWRLYFLDFQR